MRTVINIFEVVRHVVIVYCKLKCRNTCFYSSFHVCSSSVCTIYYIMTTEINMPFKDRKCPQI